MFTERFFWRGLWVIGAGIAALTVWGVLICEAAV
jgi:hypothetical protein